jgi:rfaE bifunctional protein nucleotidyltransferase chain/domain
VVLANGCFDPLHYGHILHLQAARKMGNRLVVGLTKDEFVNKGEGRPVFTLEERMHCLKALRCVDDILPCTDALDALMAIRPNIFVKGKDYKGKIEKDHEDYCRQSGIKIAFTDTKLWSSTALLHYYAR